MKNRGVFRFFSMMTILFYTAALAQAGQVITQEERNWAKEAMQQEQSLGTTSTPNSIAVLYFDNKSGHEKLNALQKGMAVMLITDLSKVDQIQVVERVRMQALLDEMELGASGLMDSNTAPKVGKLLGASYVTSGDILGGATQDILIDTAVLEILFETLTRQPIASGSLEELFKLEKEILFNIIDQMKVTVSPAQRKELEKPISASTAALLALFLAIDHSDKAQYGEAAKLYEQALFEDPNLDIARNALQELKGMGLTAVEDAVIPEETSTVPAVEAEGTSAGTVIAVALGVAVVGGGIAFALSGSDSDDEGGGDTTPPPEPPLPPTDTASPTVTPNPAAGSFVDCEDGSIVFSFSETMDQDSGRAYVTPKDFADGGSWTGSQQYTVSWTHDATGYCYDFSSQMTISLSNFQDEAGNELTGSTQFTYDVSSGY